MNMTIRKMTQEEVDELFGDGTIQFGMKPQPSLKSTLKNQAKENPCQEDLPITDKSIGNPP